MMGGRKRSIERKGEGVIERGKEEAKKKEENYHGTY